MTKMKQPFHRLSSVHTAEELIDIAFRRASRISPSLPKRTASHVKARIKERMKILAAGQAITARLKRTLSEMPDLEKIHPFYRELADVLIGIDRLKKSLGAINWASKKIAEISKHYAKRERHAQSTEEAAKLRREAYGRMASILKQISKELELLKKARDTLIKLPDIDPEAPTIVVAGYTNVGKSTFVKAVSTAKPKIASYPFTTKNIIVGHRKTEKTTIQIIDTPGLLDRPLSQRNKIELQAILALKHLAKTIIYIFDPTTTCGYPLKNQINLYKEIKQNFPKTPIITVANKADIAKKEQIATLEREISTKIEMVSALKNIGVERIIENVIKECLERP